MPASKFTIAYFALIRPLKLSLTGLNSGFEVFYFQFWNQKLQKPKLTAKKFEKKKKL